MSKYFIVRETCGFDNYIVTFDANLLPSGMCVTSSYHVLCSRVLGFTYPDYLKYCSVNGAILKGSTGYSYPAFKEKKDAEKICNLCNKFFKPYEEKFFGGK